jgi:hypothetical protein
MIEAQIITVEAGDAVIWTANELPKAWTEGQKMQAIVVHLV